MQPQNQFPEKKDCFLTFDEIYYIYIEKNKKNVGKQESKKEQMVKVFLVEDEIVIRDGIKNSIKWEKEGYEFVGEAGDGELAYPMILKERPDILITDIKMPFMDGLELSRLVKQELPDIKILILSGYDEFEYAKEAIRIGVAEYLLKPVSSSKLLEVLRGVTSAIVQERQERELLRKYEADMLENREYQKDEFLNRILTQSLSVTEILAQAKALSMDLSAQLYNTILLEVAGISSSQEDRGGDMLTAIEAAIEEQSGLYSFRRSMESWMILCLAEDTAQMEQKIQSVEACIKNILDTYPVQTEYFGSAGRPVSRIRELKESVAEAERVFACRYLKEWNQIVCSEDMPENASENTELNVGSLEIAKLDRKILVGFLKTGLRGQASSFMDEYFASLGEKNIQSLLFRQYVTMDAYLTAVSVLESIGYDSDEFVARCGDFKDMESVFMTVEHTKKYLIHLIETTIDLREAVSKGTYSSLLKAARSYIEQNFDNEEISLNTVASTVNLSPNYFSTVFSQEMGMTFIEYLTRVRMDKAKELLRSSSMKTSEVAYAVGYKDSHYFSYLFKKTQHCTPREFKSQI